MKRKNIIIVLFVVAVMIVSIGFFSRFFDILSSDRLVASFVGGYIPAQTPGVFKGLPCPSTAASKTIDKCVYSSNYNGIFSYITPGQTSSGFCISDNSAQSLSYSCDLAGGQIIYGNTGTALACCVPGKVAYTEGGANYCTQILLSSGNCGGIRNQQVDVIVSYYESLQTCPDGSQHYRGECPVPAVKEPQLPVDSGNWFTNAIASLLSWIKSALASLPALYSITGQTTVAPNSQQSYQISLSAPYPGNYNYQAGLFTYREAGWAVVDSSGAVQTQGPITKYVNDTYSTTAIITAPSNINNYQLIVLMKEWNETYSTSTNSWNIGTGSIINKEAISIATRVTTSPPLPQSTGNWFIDGIAGLWNWFIGLFSGIK